MIREIIASVLPPSKRVERQYAEEMPFIHLCCGSPEAALAALDRTALPENARLERKALLLARLSRKEEALQLLSAGKERLSKVAAFSLAVLFLEKGERAGARRFFELALEIRLPHTDALLWCLPGGMSFEKIINIWAGVRQYQGEQEEAVLDFAERAFNADILYRLAHLAFLENNISYAERMMARLEGEDVQNDRIHLMNAMIASCRGEVETTGRHLARYDATASLDERSAFSVADLYARMGRPEKAVRALLDGLDSLQILSALDVFSRTDYTALAAEYREPLSRFGVVLPDPAGFFDKGARPVDGSWTIRRFAGSGAIPLTDEVDLNVLSEPETFLTEERRLGRSVTLRFRNMQSLKRLAELSDGSFISRSPVTGDHVKEYCFTSVENLLSRCGYEITEVREKRPVAERDALIPEETVRAGRLLLSRVEYREDEWRRFFTEEYVFCARPRRFQDVSDKKVAIVILTFGQLDYTKKCLDSIRAHTDGVRYEIVVVDNASPDNTPVWLKAEKAAGRLDHLILNQENLGVAGGWNKGLAGLSPDADYVLILNNDVIVPDHWLRNLVRCADSSPDIGMVGPMTNNISGLQVEPTASYASLPEFFRYADAYMTRNEGNWWELFRIVGFCFLIKRSVMVQIGTFDERFGKGNFEDDDYCIRVRRAGFRIMVAGDAFIHHFGSVSFQNSNVNWTEQMMKNQKIFHEKWAEINREIVEKRKKSGPTLLIDEAEKLIRDKEYGRAIPLLLAVIEKEPNNYKAYNHLGVIAWFHGNLPDAANFFKETLRLKPDFTDAAFNLADVHEAASDVASARRVLQALLEQNPGLTEARARLDHLVSDSQRPGQDADFVRELLAESEKMIAQAHYDDAVNLLSILIEKSGENVDAYNLTGICAWHKGRVEEAYWFFKKALALNPIFDKSRIR